MSERRVWVGAAASVTAWGIVQSAKARWPDLHVVCADTGPREGCAASVLADAFVQVPPAGGTGWRAALEDGLREHGCDTLVPVHDLEIAAVARALDEGAFAGVATTAPGPAAASLCLDKLLCAQVLDEAGIPVPRTEAGGADWEGPCVVKPRAGVGSHGVRILDDAAARTSSERSHAFVVQERLRGPEITIDAFATRAAVCRERLEVRAGVATKVRVFTDDGLAALASRVARAAGLDSVAFCFQVIDGKVTDVNPRPGGATRMSVVAGFDLHAAMLAAAWGEDPAPYLVVPDHDVWVARGALDVVTAPN